MTPHAQRGFTLIEMMVALSLFAMLSLASVALLRTSIDTQASIAARLDEGAAVERVRAILAGSLIVAQPHAGRDAEGQRRSAMGGTASSISFVAATGDEGGGRPPLHRISVGFDNGAIILRRSDALDGAATGDPAPLLRGVTSARFRYRDASGAWNDIWAPTRADELPRAVELSIERNGSAPLVTRYLVGPGAVRLAEDAS